MPTTLFSPLMTVSDARSHGEVYTRRWVVETILDLVGYGKDQDLGAMIAIEPAAGAFLEPMVARLIASARSHARDPASLAGAIRAYDLHERSAVTARTMVEGVLAASGVDNLTRMRLASDWVVCGDFLLDETTPLADVVVGNPPYVRLEDMDPAFAAHYRALWPTMTGRADLYIAFIEKSLDRLKTGGRVGFICADRWMHNAYGSALRELIGRRYSVDVVWTMHDSDVFESSVSAYPAITVLRRGAQGAVAVAEMTAEFGPTHAGRAVRWATGDQPDHHESGVAGHRLPHWFKGTGMWPAGSPDRLALVELLTDQFPSLEQSGARVGIGVATGHDAVFAPRVTPDIEPSRLLPMVMSKDLRGDRLDWSGTHLVNPWESNGVLVDLAAYPKLAAYFAANESAIRDRFVAKARPDSWHRTIDKVEHNLVAVPKLLIPDMKTALRPVLEPGGLYPHHNLYHVTAGVRWDIEVRNWSGVGG